MRLVQFDSTDRSAFKLKFNISIEVSLKEIINRYDLFKQDYTHLSLTEKGKIVIRSNAHNIMGDIKLLFDFYNECNDDTETRNYLDTLIDINNNIILMIDKL